MAETSQPDQARPTATEPPAPPTAKRPYSRPSLTEFGSVSKLTTAKSGVSTDGLMQMTVCL